MGICATELTRWVIQPTLQRIGVTAPMACTLLLATAAQESALGSHLKVAGQRGLGIYRIHSLTHRHVWDAYLAQQPELASTVRGLASQHDFLNHPHAEHRRCLVHLCPQWRFRVTGDSHPGTACPLMEAVLPPSQQRQY